MKTTTKNNKSELRSYSKNLIFKQSICGRYYILCGFDGNPTSELFIPPHFKKKPVLSVERQAFCGITELKRLSVPETMTDLSGSRFEGCSGLLSIDVDEGNKAYYAKDNCLIEIERKALILGCKNSIIPNDGSVENIDSYAFRFCTSLSHIHIPTSVSLIKNGAFYGCSGLECITLDEDNEVFYCTDNCLVERRCKNLVLGCKNSKIPDDGRVKIIGNGAFAGCKELSAIDIPAAVTTINMDAFYGCSGLSSIKIPFSVVTICGGAFYGCEKLRSITYGGTKAEWQRLKKGKYWDFGIPEYTVICTDGTITKKNDKKD